MPVWLCLLSTQPGRQPPGGPLSQKIDSLCTGACCIVLQQLSRCVALVLQAQQDSMDSLQLDLTSLAEQLEQKGEAS